MFRISLLIALLSSVAASVPQRLNAAPPEPTGAYHLTVNLETGATTRTAVTPLAVSRPAGAQPKKVALDRAETPSTAVREGATAPLKGSKKIRMGAPLPAGSKPLSKPVVSAEPYIYRVLIHNIRNLRDEDHDGFYSAFAFDIGICADISEGTLPVWATIFCTTTGQQWYTDPWNVISGLTYWMDVGFDETDFQRQLNGDTYLDFYVEIHYSVGTKLDSTPYVEGEPFPADPAPAPYIYEAKILNVRNTTDEDNDGYYSRFDFDIGIDADDPHGQALVSAIITCDTTGQSWCTEQPWQIYGIQPGYARIGFSESDFGAHITGNTDLDFTVELYNSTLTVLYDEATAELDKEPFKADPLPPHLAVVKIHNLSGLLDLDHDGYYAQFAFDIGIDADGPQAPAEVAAKITCITTGQVWDTASWTVEGLGQDFANVRFDQSDFAGYLSGNTNLDFTVELYDGTLSYRLDTRTAVENEPFRADIGLPRIAEAKIYNLANLKDEDADGYYSQYDFDLGINAVVDAGTLTVAGRILCPVTGQTWDIAPWTITAGTESWKNVRFNEARFAGYLTGNTQLYFTVEIYDATWATPLGSTSSVSGQPFPVDPIKAPDDAYALVRHFYNTVLAREPEPGAVDAWINGYFLYSLYSEIDVRFIGREMGRIFFFSQEYANRNRDNAEFITDCYQAFLWRNPSDAELAAWLGGVWNRAEAMTIFAESEEFDDLMSVQWFPGYAGRPVRNFVTTMYIGFLDRLPDLGGLDYWSATLEQAADKRQASKQMALAILHSTEYLGRNELASTTVIRLYRSFMGRFPGDGEVAYWTDELTSGRQTLAQIVSAFGNSEEFTMRLGQYF